jgi:hypothetical protein
MVHAQAGLSAVVFSGDERLPCVDPPTFDARIIDIRQSVQFVLHTFIIPDQQKQDKMPEPDASLPVQVPADLITGQLTLSLVTLIYGVVLLLPANQGLHYVLYDAFRRLAPVWNWGIVAVLVSVLHFVGYALRHTGALAFALVFCAGYWAFISAFSLHSAWYLPSGWTTMVFVGVYVRSAFRLGYWARRH